ncbi:MAG: FtsQ-type POTRA domain-containing protein [Sphaerochaetaceae bacterium]|nr:FtsQ-type POTRA domain-containing protein [Spirochaetales bacterium]MDY5500734.1 FtsQ-type POTRA domain-containing protein [Sphaerochaetaceae bacterium]
MRAARIAVTLVIFGMLCCIGVYTLQYIPAFVVNQVLLQEEQGRALPKSVMEVLASQKGKPLFGDTKGELAKALSQEPLIDRFSISRKLPDKFSVKVALRPLEAILVVSEGDRVQKLMGLGGKNLYPIELADGTIYPDSVVRVVITPSYAAMIEDYGVDDGLVNVVRYLGSLEGNMSLITTVKYDNNSSNRLGRVVLQLASLHAEVCIREEVTPELLRKAIDVVASEERGQLHLDNEWTRYDVYASGIVRR